MSSVLGISWITWAITTFLLAAAIASLLKGRHRVTHPLYGKEEVRAGAGTKAVRATPGQGTAATPETRAVDAGVPTTTAGGGAAHQQTV